MKNSNIFKSWQSVHAARKNFWKNKKKQAYFARFYKSPTVCCPSLRLLCHPPAHQRAKRALLASHCNIDGPSKIMAQWPRYLHSNMSSLHSFGFVLFGSSYVMSCFGRGTTNKLSFIFVVRSSSFCFSCNELLWQGAKPTNWFSFSFCFSSSFAFFV